MKETVPADEQPAEQENPAQTQYVAPTPANHEKSNKGLYVIIVILLLLLLCFVGYFLLNQPKGTTASEEATDSTTVAVEPSDKVEPSVGQPSATSAAPAAKASGKEIVVNGEGVRMRFGPSLKAGYLKTPQGGTLSVTKGTHLPCVGEEGDWYKVVYQGKQYYMSKQFCYLVK